MRTFTTRLTCLFFVLMMAQSNAQVTDFMWHRGFFFGQTALPAFNYFPDSLSQQFGFEDSTSMTNRRALQFGLNWGARVNLYNFDDEHSLSLHADVLASVYLENDVFGQNETGFSEVSYGLQIPVFVNYNIGHMSTKNSAANHGFAVGLGIELNAFRYEIDNVDYSGFSTYDRSLVEANTNFWVQPVLNLGYRFWKDGIDARELNLQLGYGYVDRLSTGTSYRPNIRLSYHKFINY